MIAYPVTHRRASGERIVATSLGRAELKLWTESPVNTEVLGCRGKQCRSHPSPLHRPGWEGLCLTPDPFLVGVHRKQKCSSRIFRNLP